MSQRPSGYERKERDCYETPEWVTAALIPHLPARMHIWEPAAGSGKMVPVLAAAGHLVEASDVVEGRDFLSAGKLFDVDAIVTNPPYALAAQFIEHALGLARIVAMLLRTDFDHAAGRRHLFATCGSLAKKLVLTRRIVWFDGPKAAPSFNHAWYIWDRQHQGPPTLAYGP
jgi:hypothetical protein